MNKKTIGLLIMLVFILLTIWGYNSLYNSKVVDNVNTNLNNKPEEIDNSDWVEYRNEELGFEFKYPSDWMMESKKVNYGEYTADEVYFYVVIDTNNPSESNHFSKIIITTFENIKGESSEEVIATKENFSPNELKGLFLEEALLDRVVVEKYMIPGFISLPALIFSSNDKVYQIKYNLEDHLFFEIINTFKFI